MSRSQERVPPTDDGGDRRDRYHHGDLRESLIIATHDLVLQRGAEHFSLADACRHAGVSTAAPYKHFRDKQEILEIVCQRGFDAMRSEMASVVDRLGAGTLEALQGMGRTYLALARSQPNMFRLMFGQNADLKHATIVDEAGTGCFGYLISQIALFIERQGRSSDPRMQALKLWTFVHGAACLLIDNDYDKMAPDLDVEAMMAEASQQLLA